jgi:hypothetical protein
LPAGTIKAEEFGVVRGGAICGHCEGDVSAAPPGPKISPRVTGCGEIKPVEGVAESSEFCPPDCPDAAPGISKARMSASPGHSRPRAAAIAGALSMTGVFSA